MSGRIALLLACFLLIDAAEAETFYKYRRPDGRTVYSNKPEPGLDLIETFEYKFADPMPAHSGATQREAESEARITKRLDDLQAAWTEVQETRAALAQAEERLRAGSVRGAVRSRPSPQYMARVEALEADVAAARVRYDAALRRYNELR